MDEFILECNYNQADFDGLVKAQAFRMKPAWAFNKVGEGILRAAALILLALAILSLSGLLRMMVAEETEGLLIQLGTTIIFGLLGFWVLRKSGWAGSGRMAWKGYPLQGKLVRYIFNETGFQVETPVAKTENTWGAILAGYEDQTHFFLFDTPRTAHILPKADFVQGKAADFGAFVEACTGKAIIQIH